MLQIKGFDVLYYVVFQALRYAVVLSCAIQNDAHQIRRWEKRWKPKTFSHPDLMLQKTHPQRKQRRQNFT